MKVKLKLVKFDQDNPVGIPLYEGEGELNDFQLSYLEGNIENIVIIEDEKITLTRVHEFGSNTELYLDKVGKSIVSSPYGNMELDTLLIDRSIEKDTWLIEYEIRQNDECLNHQTLIWQWEELSDE